MYISLERILALISLQIYKHYFVMKSSENFALAKYTYHFEMFKSFKTNCRLSYFNCVVAPLSFA